MESVLSFRTLLCCPRSCCVSSKSAVLSSKASRGGQEQIRLRSPAAPSIRPTGGKYLSCLSVWTGKTACSRGYSRVQSVLITAAAVCGALRSGLCSTVKSPWATWSISLRMLIMAVMKRSISHQVLGLGRLHHQGAGHRERQGGGVEAVVDQALGHVLGRHAGLGREFAQVQDALVRDQAARAGVEHREVLIQPGRNIVRREQRRLGGLGEALAAHELHVRPGDRQDPGGAVAGGGDRRCRRRRWPDPQRRPA